MAALHHIVLSLLTLWVLSASTYPTTAAPAPTNSLVTKTSIFTFSTSRIIHHSWPGFDPSWPAFEYDIDDIRTGTVTHLVPQPTTFPATITIEATTSETITQVERLTGSPPTYTRTWTYVWIESTTSVVTAPPEQTTA